MRTIADVSYDYEGRTVLVTGAGRGQGRAHALAFAAAGADLVLCDIGADIPEIPFPLATVEELEGVAGEAERLGVRAQVAVCDVRDQARVDEMVAAAEREFGAVDILINNAGVNSKESVEEMTPQIWHAVLDPMLDGTLNCSRAVVPGMKRRGRGKITITGSVTSFVALPDHTHYVTAKHALLGLARSLAVELAPSRINVNMVAPGAVDTVMARSTSGLDAEWMEYVGNLTGAWNLIDPGQALDPEEITNAILWLCSDAADYVTGTTIVVDAGLTIT